MKHLIYLDHNASTPIDREVLKVLIKELETEIGNPSSIHSYGQQCRQKLEGARTTIARYLKVRPQELIFTSGGTEGANLLIQGLLPPNGHIVTSNIEHSCVYNTIKGLEQKGYTTTFLSAGLLGAIAPEVLAAAIQPNTKLIVLAAANNETGVKNDIHAFAAIAHAKRIPLIVDAVALLGKESFSIPLGVTAMFFSGHKLHAPKGIGVAFCRTKLKPLFTGGAQELSRRAGTENLPGIVALAAAFELLVNQESFTQHMQTLRDQLENGLQANLSDVIINGQGPRVANTSNLSFLGIDGESLLLNLDMEGICVSHGSACASGAIEPSRILVNMGVQAPGSAIRFSLSRFTTEEEIDRCIEVVTHLIQRMLKFKRHP
jgi:cysteine desulfurase